MQLTSEQLAAIRSQFSILQLRQQNAVQRWKEISQSGNYDYKEQIYKHWGIRVPDSLSHLSTYHGGIARNLDISEVVNTALDTEGSEATIHGKGVGSGAGSINFTVREHSVIMVCYHAVPLMDYSLLGVDPQLMATDATDLPIPEMDNIGMESVSLLNFFNAGTLGFANVRFCNFTPFDGVSASLLRMEVEGRCDSWSFSDHSY